jgi:hypothetical protein
MEDQQAQINQGMLANMQAIAQQLQALQAQINAMAAAQAANPGGDVAPATIAAVFADTPGRRKADDIIDYSTTTGMKIYKEASTELKVKFDVESSQVVLFCEALKSRAQDSGWALGAGDIINIPDAKEKKTQLVNGIWLSHNRGDYNTCQDLPGCKRTQSSKLDANVELYQGITYRCGLAQNHVGS